MRAVDEVPREQITPPPIRWMLFSCQIKEVRRI